MDSLIQLYWERFDSSDQNVAKIATFLGADTGSLDLAQRSLDARFAHPAGGCFAASADTLSCALQRLNGDASMLRRLAGQARLILVYGFRPDPAHGELLHRITSGALTGIDSVSPPVCYEVSSAHPDWFGPFSGLTFGSVHTGADAVFRQDEPAAHLSVLVRAGGKPSVVLIELAGTRWLLMGAGKVADLAGVVQAGDPVLRLFSSLVPVMAFVRRALGEFLWHTPQPRACFVLDDPPLWPRYGPFRYDALLETMKVSGFSTSVAFIPWNHRRSRREAIGLFAGNPGRYSLCVHGCDHSAGEFGGTSLPRLMQLAETALDRMRQHRQRSGIDFDEVMVFPQGVFSATAMLALRSTGYLAAVNTTPFTVDARTTGLPLSELLGVALLRYDNLPLFLRRYPGSVAESAFDLFVGKPVLIVEHPAYFRDGYRRLGEFVERINALDERLEWTSLATICSKACQQRRRPDGGFQVRFYTDRFDFRNAEQTTQSYEFLRRLSPNEQVNGVWVNNKPAEYARDQDGLRLQARLPPGCELAVRIDREAAAGTPIPAGRDPLRAARVTVRRLLCDIRDHYVERSAWLAGAVRSARTLRPRRPGAK